MTHPVRLKMKEAGLYKKFHDDAKLIVDFKKFLTESLRVTNCQQEVRSLYMSMFSTPSSAASHRFSFSVSLC